MVIWFSFQCSTKALSHIIEQSDEKSQKQLNIASELASGTVTALSTVYMGLENSSRILAHHVSNNTVELVSHKWVIFLHLFLHLHIFKWIFSRNFIQKCCWCHGISNSTLPRVQSLQFSCYEPFWCESSVCLLRKTICYKCCNLDP